MNKLELFIEKIGKLTDTGKLHWDHDIGPSNSDLIKDLSRVTQKFITEYKGKNIIAIEKKIPEFYSDYEEFYDRMVYELYITSGGYLEKLVTDTEVASDYVRDLLRTVSKKVNRTDEYIDNIIEE